MWFLFLAAALVPVTAALAPVPPPADAVVYPLVGTDWRMVAVADHLAPHPPDRPRVELAAGLPGPGPAGDADAERSRHAAADYASAVLHHSVEPVELGDLRGPSGALVLTLASLQAATGGDWSPVPLAATGDLVDGWVLPVGQVPTKVHAAGVTGAAAVFVPDEPSSAVLPSASFRDKDAMYDAGRTWATDGRPFVTVPVIHVADVLWFLCGAEPGEVCELAERTEPTARP